MDAASDLRGSVEVLQRDLASAVATVCRTLSTRRWGWRSLDRHLRLGVQQCLDALRCVGVIAHFHPDEVTLAHFAPTLTYPLMQRGTGAVADLVDELHVAIGRGLQELRDTHRGEVAWQHRVRDLAVVALPIGDPATRPDGSGERRDYAALVFNQREIERWPEIARAFPLNYCGWTALGVFFQALRQRTRVFSPFPPPISQRYWADALSGPNVESLAPPWDSPDGVLTATLSLDLRKSTFCMEQADSAERFATWMDELVQIITLVAHEHGGVFDKFTGDGSLVHFLDRECRIVYGRSGVDAAVGCAAAMHLAISDHLCHLRKILRIDSELLGAAIGIDVGRAHWSLDHRYNPIAVGRGIVGACRLTAGVAAGKTRLSNIAYQLLPEETGNRLAFHRVPYSTKDISSDLQLRAWESDHLTLTLCCDPHALHRVRAICDGVYRRERADGSGQCLASAAS